jgi:hypothetical protein
MRGPRAAAILGVLATVSGACEVLVGITDRQAATFIDSGADATGTGEAGPGDAPVAATDAPVGVDATADAAVGPESSASADGGQDADAATSPPIDASDAARSTDATDGGTGALPDAADAADAAWLDPDLPCSMQPAYSFCCDFDNSGAVGDGWGFTYQVADGGSAQLDTVTWVSSPKSAQVVATPLSGRVAGFQIGTTISPFPAGVRLAFDVRIDVPTYTSFPEVGIAQLYLHQGTSAQTQINFVVGGGSQAKLQAYVPEAGAALNVAVTPPALGAWERVVVSYTVDGTLALLVNGQPIGSVDVGGGAAQTVQLIVGAVYVNDTGSETVTLELDNIVVRAQ